MKVVVLLLALCCFHQTSGDTHSLKYIFTAVSGISEIPEYSSVGLVNDVPFVYFDTNINRDIPKTKWIEEAEGKDYWDKQTQVDMLWAANFKVDMQTLKERFNQTKSTGVHVFQWMYGCQWDDDNSATDSNYQLGYDGEDFISADVKNMRWIAPVPEALATKQKWESGRDIQMWKAYATSQCIDWLKKYVNYGSSTLGRKDSPKVTIFQKDSSGIVCHATGFYPDGVMITWKRDGVEVHDDVDVGETLPNNDGTFQKRAVLTVSSEEWKKYTCEVAHKSGSFVRTVNPDELDNGGSVSIGLIVGLVICGILFFVCIAGFFWWRKRNSGFVPANTKDDGSASSDESPRRV